MAQKQQNAIAPTRAENYPEWYQQVVKEADLAETSVVRGCMVIKPWGYSLWENMQSHLDRRFKETGHQNAYFPLFIPKSFLEKEAEHVEGFAKECAVVTHSRLEDDGEGGLKTAGELDEPLIVRPTSEMIIGESFARWIQSYRDLPLLINQWANIVRWEMRTRLFLRTAEFLWQEGHTAHATAAEAEAETLQMLDVYAEFAEEVMAMPVLKGRKTESEKFPGAVTTYSIEAMMQDKRALQAGTSHYMGQNFAKSLGIRFQSEAGKEEYCYTTSWGVSTRLIGGLVMAHSDDDGLVLPPRLAPQQIVILPVIPKEDQRKAVMAYCEQLRFDLAEQTYAGAPLRVHIDARDLRGGEKVWSWVKKGVPIRLEIGPRDIEKNAVFMARRDRPPKEKEGLERAGFIENAAGLLQEIQGNLYQRALDFRRDNTVDVSSEQELTDYFKNGSGFARCYYAEDPTVEERLGTLKITARNQPLGEAAPDGNCIFSGKPGKLTVFAKAY